jgi:alpha-maltose-1-phosphate synthase
VVTLSHSTGNQNSRQAALALAEAGLLDEMWTALCWKSGCSMERIIPQRLREELRRRSFPTSLMPYTRTRPWREALRLACVRLGMRNLVAGETALLSIDSVLRDFDLHVAARLASKRRAQGVYAYEDAALATFREAKKAGSKCLYDLPIGYWRAGRRVLSEEAERRPDWLESMEGLQDSAEKLARKDEELRLADHILVASTFTMQTLREATFPLAPISVIPYGANDVPASPVQPGRTAGGTPLKALFVGGLSQRKGIADLFEALEMVGSGVELTMVGRKPSAFCKPLESALKKHRWIESLPRERILEEMRLHDVLVFPSLFEGFGLVVTEALSQGLPVITTSHTCGPDVLTEGEDGFIVPIRDPQAIAEKLELLHRDRERLAAMHQAALKRAEMLTWESYRRGVVEVVREAMALA